MRFMSSRWRGSSFLSLGLLAATSGSVWAQTISKVDYSDTFTVAEHGGRVDRTDGIYNTPAPYVVEDFHGNSPSSWNPISNFSFNTGLGSACCGYPTNDGNDGSASGLAQSGAGDFSFAYGLRSNYIVKLQAILPLDRLDISSLPSAGANIFTPGSLSVFFRRDGAGTGTIGFYNGSVETVVKDDLDNDLTAGIAADDNTWHTFGVHFNQAANLVGIYVDDVLLAEVDLTTFGGGAYLGYSNAAVGAGGEGYDFVTKVLWIDNVYVGAPSTIIDACFSSSKSSGPAPLSVDFNADCSIFAGTAMSYDWTFGDGGVASGAQVTHNFTAGGSYEVTLTVKDTLARTASTSRTITVYDVVSSFTDNFDRPDGPIDGWTVYAIADGWNILGGELQTGPSNEERWIWAGDPPSIFPSKIVLEFDMRFLSAGTNPGVGRHAGAAFCGSTPTHRYDATFSGYFVDWIDRAGDHGFRFTRVNSGALTELVLGAPGSPAEPPLTWRVEVTNTKIRVYGDGTLYIDYEESTYRGGFAGLWTWAGGQEVAYDNFSLTQNTDPVTACFSLAGPEAPISNDVLTFDATCTENLTGGATTYLWNFGDASPQGNGVSVTHAYAAPGRYEVTLRARDTLGNESTDKKTVTIYQKAVTFSDNFDRPDGPITGWTEYSPGAGWNILNGTLVTGPSSREHWIWAGDTPIIFPKNATYEWDQTFTAPGTNPVVGRHGGLAFCASRPTHRYDAGWSGYFVDWIDRVDDRGLRLSRVDSGAFTEIIRGQANIAVPDEPPLVWRVEVDGDFIRLFGDDTQYFEVVDSTHRGGFSGFWTWEGGQELAFDNFNVIGQSVSGCFVTSPALFPAAGQVTSFDATCSESFSGTVTSYDWDFGDGATGTGATTDHTYAAGGEYLVKLTVKDSTNATAVLERKLTVYEPLTPFADCFNRAEGPVDGWTTVSGTWNITADGTVETVTGGEAFLYAGDPAAPLTSDFVSSVDWELVSGTNPVVGRHAAVHFYWNKTTNNRFAADSRGYAVFYIDRLSDRGLTLARWDLGGVLTVLNPPGGTPNLTEPPAQLGIEVTGPRIVVTADGVPVIDVEDSTYRDGYFALWSWNENTVRFDNVRIGVSQLPECTDTPLEPKFVRGDADSNAKIQLTDAVTILNYLFVGGNQPGCFDAADADDNGQLQLTDAVRVLGWLFLGQAAPSPPSPTQGDYPKSDCGIDPTPDSIGCAAFAPCP